MPQEFDFANPPFDRLSAREWSKVRDSLQVASFRAGATMLHAGDEPDHLYVVIAGEIEERDGGEIVAVYGPKDSFDTRAVIDGRARADFVVHEDATCHLMPRGVVRALADANPAFAAFLYRDISRRLAALAERAGGEEVQPLMAARVREAFIRPPLYIDADASVLDSAALMRANHARSTLVRDGERVGIVTAGSLAGRVILDKVPVETRLRDLARFDLVSVAADDSVFDALLAMTRHGIQRIVVRDGGDIVGTLDQVDVLSFLAHQSHIVAAEIDRASTVADLRRASDALAEEARVLQRNGMGYPQIARLVSELNRRLFAKLYALVAPPEMVAHSCLIVMGSDGRGEQVLRADQDNGLILRDGVAFPALERVRADFTRTLVELGYPPCDGKVMVDNPAWSKPLASFRDAIKHWILLPEEDSALNLAIFCDAAPVAGDASLLGDARAYMASLLSDNPGFFERFAAAIDAFDAPIGTFWRLFGTAGGGLDIKKVGLFPIVHGVRSLALQLKLPETGTIERIRRLAEHGALDEALAKELTDAFVFLQGLRLRSRLAKGASGAPVDNVVEPRSLGTLERDLLKDSLAIVKHFKARVRARVTRHGL